MAFIVIRSTTPSKRSSSPIGNWIGNRHRAEAIANFVDDTQEIGARAIHLVDEDDARHCISVGLTPDRFGLRFDARRRAEHDARTVEHAQTAFDFDREVDVPGRVDDVDAMFRKLLIHAAPETGGAGRGDGDASLLLLLHPIHDRRAVVHLTQRVRHTGVEEHAFRRRRLPRIHVRNDADVAIA